MKQTSKIAILAVALFTGFGGTALAATPLHASGPYVSGSAGIGIPGDWDETSYGVFKVKTGVPLYCAVGYNYGSARLEAAAGYQKFDWKDVAEDTSITTLMANAYYDFDTSSNYRPYVMGGLGIADVNVSWDTDSSTVFAWQLGAGIGVKAGNGWTVDLGYRYLKPSGLQCPTDKYDVSWEVHTILAGVRYQF